MPIFMTPTALCYRSAQEDIVAKRSREETLTDIERLAQSLETSLRTAILAYLLRAKEDAPLGAILDALRAGQTGKVLELIEGLDMGQARAAVASAVMASVWAGGAAAASQINLSLRGAYFAFDKLNPQLITWLRGYSFNLVREIDRQTKESVRTALVSGMAKGDNPITVARDVKQAIGLTAKQAQSVANFRNELETFHLRRSAESWNLGGKIDRVNNRQVFKPDEDGSPRDGIDSRRLRDFRFDGSLRRAMKTGKPLKPEQIDRMVAAYERKFLRHRAQTIARTEALRTTNQGVQEAWRQAIQTNKADGALVRRLWVVARDERLCHVCSPVPRLNPKRGVRMDEPFQTPDGPAMLPPLHPACRCIVFIRQFEPSQLL